MPRPVLQPSARTHRQRHREHNKPSTGLKENRKKKAYTDLQASLCAVGLLSLPRRLLGTTLSTDRLSFSTGHVERKTLRTGIAAMKMSRQMRVGRDRAQSWAMKGLERREARALLMDEEVRNVGAVLVAKDGVALGPIGNSTTAPDSGMARPRVYGSSGESAQQHRQSRNMSWLGVSQAALEN